MRVFPANATGRAGSRLGNLPSHQKAQVSSAQLTILSGDCRDILLDLPDASVQCCVTSPPYWKLRDYNGNPRQIGQEPTPEEFIKTLVGVFREVRRVLRDDGTCWVNLGDSYSQGMSNIPDILQSFLECGVLFCGSADPTAAASESLDVFIYDKTSPNRVFKPLLGLQRIFIKEGNDDLCQIGNQFNSPVRYYTTLVGCGFPGDTNAEFISNLGKNLSVVVAAGKLDSNSSLSSISLPVHNSEASFTVEVSGEPVGERIISDQSTLNTMLINLSPEGGLHVDFVNESVSFRDGFKSRSSNLSSFRITKATREKFALSVMNGVCEVAFLSVGHCYFVSSVGVTRYSHNYDKAEHKANETGPKQELGMPDLLKRALMRDGWICRQTIIWAKPNPMPESVTDRCTKSHEYIFLLSKSERYYYDQDAICEECSPNTHARLAQNVQDQIGSARVPGKTNGNMKAVARKYDPSKLNKNNKSFNDALAIMPENRNKRSVWTVPTAPCKEAHFATYPPDLIKPCILAGTRPGDTVIDPFGGSGTTGAVALELGRSAILIELEESYLPIMRRRTNVTPGFL